MSKSIEAVITKYSRTAARDYDKHLKPVIWVSLIMYMQDTYEDNLAEALGDYWDGIKNETKAITRQYIKDYKSPLVSGMKLAKSISSKLIKDGNAVELYATCMYLLDTNHFIYNGTKFIYEFVSKRKASTLSEVLNKIIKQHSRRRDYLKLKEMLDGSVTDSWGNKKWYQNGELHRDGDEPARINSDQKEWYQNGELHRDGDKPAMIDTFGMKKWYQKGKLHRDGDKPAMTDNFGKEWYQNGKRHRDGDKPAYTSLSGRLFWYQKGKLHRDGDKPARIKGNQKEWYQNGERHRDGDKPALVNDDGVKIWYRNDTVIKFEGISKDDIWRVT